MSFADAKNIDWLVREFIRALGRRQDDSGAPVRNEGTIQQVQRIGDHSRAEYVVDCNDLPHLRIAVERRMFSGADSHCRELFRSCAISIHVCLRYQCVIGWHGGTVRDFKLRMSG